MEGKNLVIGKWHKVNYDGNNKDYYFKPNSENRGESITGESHRRHYGSEDCWATDYSKVEILEDLSEIQKYLPAGHPDLQVKSKSLVGRYVKCILKTDSPYFTEGKYYKILAGDEWKKGKCEVQDDISSSIVYKSINCFIFMPEGFSPEEELNEKQTKNNMTQTVKKSDLKKIHDVACEGWKNIIRDLALSNPFGDTVELKMNTINKMFDAATSYQIPVLEEVFGKRNQTLDFRSKNVVSHVDGIRVFGNSEMGVLESFISLPGMICHEYTNEFHLNPNYNWTLEGTVLTVTKNKIKI